MAAEPLPEDLTRELERRLEAEQTAERLPSIVEGVVRDGRVLWWGASGTAGLDDDAPLTNGTQYRIGSITKTFVAVAVMRLRDEGSLDLADLIGSHLRELADLRVTIGQLLSHTSGLRAETPGPWWERTPGGSFPDLVPAALKPQDLLCRPGRRFHYSNVGYAVLGELVARLRGMPFEQVLASELLGPLDMTRTTLRPEPPHARGLAVHPHADVVHHEPEHDARAMAPAGQLWSTVDDLAVWSQVLSGGRPDVLSSESAAEMSEPIGIIDLPDRAWTSAYGLGLQLLNYGGVRRYGHTGGMPGHWAILLVDAKTRYAVVALSNSTYSGLRPTYFDELLTLVASRHPVPQPRFRPEPALAEGMELTGTWYWGPVEYAIKLAGEGRLELRGAREGRDCFFHPRGDGTYVGDAGYFNGEQLVPVRRPDGSVSHLDIASFVFTRSPYDPSAAIPGGVDEGGWHAC